jgi:hypothetical protein
LPSYEWYGHDLSFQVRATPSASNVTCGELLDAMVTDIPVFSIAIISGDARRL